MKNLDLNAYGVEKMNFAQLQKIEGGCVICDVVVAVVKHIIENLSKQEPVIL